MKKLGKPVPKDLEKTKAIAKGMVGEEFLELNFTNTEIAFAHKTDAELKKAAWLFGVMNKAWMVSLGSKVGLAGIRM